KQRPRGSPTDVVRRVVGIAADECEEVVREHRIGGQPEGDESRSRLSFHERAPPVMLLLLLVRSGPLQLERPDRSAGEVERRLGIPASAQNVQRPDDSGSAGVEDFRWLSVAVLVPLVRRPEIVRVEGGVGIGDDRRDRIAEAFGNPRLIDRRLELVELVQHNGGHCSSPGIHTVPRGAGGLRIAERAAAVWIPLTTPTELDNLSSRTTNYRYHLVCAR